MKSDDELKEVDIKNGTCYYFDGIIKIEDFDFDDIPLPISNCHAWNSQMIILKE